MKEILLNQRTYTLKRIQICDLILAMTCLTVGNPDATKWQKLHDALVDQLNDQDIARIEAARKEAEA
jgi:hypothetical protein